VLDVHTVGRCEIPPASESVDVIAESESDLADCRVCEEIREFLRHAYMGESEEIAPLMGGYLDERRGIMDASCERRP
jgi:hypothetical protein